MGSEIIELLRRFWWVGLAIVIVAALGTGAAVAFIGGGGDSRPVIQAPAGPTIPPLTVPLETPRRSQNVTPRPSATNVSKTPTPTPKATSASPTIRSTNGVQPTFPHVTPRITATRAPTATPKPTASPTPTPTPDPATARYQAWAGWYLDCIVAPEVPGDVTAACMDAMPEKASYITYYMSCIVVNGITHSPPEICFGQPPQPTDEDCAILNNIVSEC